MSYTWGRRCAMRPTGSPEELERRRLRALELLKQGLLPSEVARRVDVDRRSVRRWKSAARQAGAAALRAKPASGRPLKLVERHRRKLEALLLKGAQAAGFHTELWTCPRGAELSERRFGVCYHGGSFGDLLHEWGGREQRAA